MEEGETNATEPPEGQVETRNSRRLGIGCAGLIGVVIAASVISSLVGKDDGDQGGYVKVACRDWVKDRLKSPGSADFSNEQVQKRSGSTYVVTGDVDSENSFGASIRNSYRCEATHNGDSTRLVSLTGVAN